MSVYGRAHTHGLADAKNNDQAADDDWDTDPDYVVGFLLIFVWNLTKIE